jgi:hypothetical protein
MARQQLDGLWLNGHIRQLLEEREAQEQEQEQSGAAAEATKASENGGAVCSFQNSTDAAVGVEVSDQTAQALRDALAHAEKMVEAARFALASYVGVLQQRMQLGGLGKVNNGNGRFDAAASAAAEVAAGSQRRGPTSRELSGEMGGDTSVQV